jgi:hypothetical protein
MVFVNSLKVTEFAKHSCSNTTQISKILVISLGNEYSCKYALLTTFDIGYMIQAVISIGKRSNLKKKS